MATAFGSSLLIVGHPNPKTLEVGADICSNLKSATALLKSNSYKVITVPLIAIKKDETLKFLQFIYDNYPQTLIVLVDHDSDFEFMRLAANSQNVAQVISSFSDSRFDKEILQALELYDQTKQSADLIHLFKGQNEKLSSLSEELEKKVEQRESTLTRSRQRLLSTNNKIEAMHKALIAIHRASAVGEMEAQLNESLREFLHLEWTRLIVGTSEATQMEQKIESSKQFQLLKFPLMAGPVQLGRILFAREAKRKFRKDERDFLSQVAEGVTLAFDRLLKLEQSESLKQQWEATFDAISTPICLTDEHFNILRTNRAFADSSGKSYTSLRGKNCFEAFFGKQTPQDVRDNKNDFEFSVQGEDGKISTYRIHLQRLSSESQNGPMTLLLFRDLTEQRRLEKQILESAKMAELGTIGSSIAHELNNPLGGMISFLQLLKADPKLPDDIKPDVIEMEAAGQRCKNIVENLLGFSRKIDSLDTIEFDLRDAINQALQITELQTRSRGIKVTVSFPNEPTPITGNANLLSQALCNLMQISSQAVKTQMAADKTFQGTIEVNLNITKDQYEVVVGDNARRDLASTSDTALHPELGVTLAHKIIGEHQGDLEIIAQPGSGSQAKISFQRPDFKAKSQVFDGEL